MAKRNSTADYINKKRERAAATRQVAEAYPEGPVKERALEVANSLDWAVRREVAESTPGYVLTLPSTAAAIEVKEARRRRAVKYGDDVFLPEWWESKVGLPNVLLRSSLFSAIRPNARLQEKHLGSPRQYDLWASGPQLCDYDRRVFAVCLKYYSDERPLSSTDEQWVHTTFWQMSKAMNVSYTANVHLAIRKSLARLNDVQLRIAIKGHEVPVHRLIDLNIEHDPEVQPKQDEPLKGSESIVLRVSDSLAMLFGPNEWSHISEQALHKTEGLASWLFSFYSTHSRSHPLTIKEIYDFSGSICPMFDFRRRLKTALKKLQSNAVPAEFRVASFELKKDSLVVQLACW